MFSKNLSTFLSISAILFIAMVIGVIRSPERSAALPVAATVKTDSLQREQPVVENVPSIGRIRVLNGCGAAGAADKMTDFLRAKKFDVTNKGNAASWNYPFTLVISHTKDMTIARQIARALNTDHCVLIRKEDRSCDVTVIIGPDYGERIR
ncbi:MAG: LytR C-terminal domain-containing protein [Chitinispirillaceae bacterium]|jgi:hypothetical protein